MKSEFLCTYEHKQMVPKIIKILYYIEIFISRGWIKN